MGPVPAPGPRPPPARGMGPVRRPDAAPFPGCDGSGVRAVPSARGIGPEVARGIGPEVARGIGPEVAPGIGPEVARGIGPEFRGAPMYRGGPS